MALARYRGGGRPHHRRAARGPGLPRPRPAQAVRRLSTALGARGPSRRTCGPEIEFRSSRRCTDCDRGRSRDEGPGLDGVRPLTLRFPLQMTTQDRRLHRQEEARADQAVPLVLMLEPLHACNLTCTGCGRIREYESTIKEKLSVEECLAAVDECGAPVVRICGGEPMIYPGIGELVAKILERKKARLPLHQRHVHPQEARTSSSRTNRFFFNVHLDGLEETHDIAVEREGVFDAGDRRHQGRQGGRLPGLHQHHGLQGNRHGRDRRAVRLPDRRSASTAS